MQASFTEADPPMLEKRVAKHILDRRGNQDPRFFTF